MPLVHKSVLLHESIELLQVKPNHWYIDATLGSAGHTLEILKQGGKVIGLDQDPDAVIRARNHVESNCPNSLQNNYFFHHANFTRFAEIMTHYKIETIDGILFDLGFSSDQMADPQKGLSFQIDSPLDMRLDPNLGVTAADMINVGSITQLTDLFKTYGDEPKAKKIAEEIVKRRSSHPISTTKDLAEIIKNIYQHTHLSIHPATKVFQALRIAVNSELQNLTQILPQTIEKLSPGGRFVCISFHSGEDKIIKSFIREYSQGQNALIQDLTPKPIYPTQQEIKLNPRARSAKLRGFQKL